MMNEAVLKMAQENLEKFKNNPYPGRGILTGLKKGGGKFIQAYWIMGRSPGSRNRIFIDIGSGRVETKQAILDDSVDTSLTIYRVMDEDGGVYAVSNGHQTKEFLSSLWTEDFVEAAMEWTYEPDEPHYTPRITSSLCDTKSGLVLNMSVIKKAPFNPDCCERQFFTYDGFPQGIGWCITTYDGDGSPLPSFSGEPYCLPFLGETKEEIAENIWNSLNSENKVALVIKEIDMINNESEIHIINKYEPSEE